MPIYWSRFLLSNQSGKIPTGVIFLLLFYPIFLLYSCYLFVQIILSEIVFAIQIQYGMPHHSQKICDVVHSKILHGIKASLMQNNFHCCFQLLPLVIWFLLLAFLKYVVEVRNFKECCLQVHEEMVKDSKNDPVQISSSVASSVFDEVIFHEDNIRATAINTVEEKVFHLS